MTKGEYRVGLTYNPQNIDTVWLIKKAAAQLIDMIDTIHVPDGDGFDEKRNAEVARLKALAQTAVEEGAMWAVKAATNPAMEE